MSPMVPDNGPYPWEQNDLSYRETEYLVFRELRTTGKKTRMWSVESKRWGDNLGTIQWYGRWRQYVVHADAIFNAGCLKDITQFLEDAMRDWRDSKNKQGDSISVG